MKTSKLSKFSTEDFAKWYSKIVVGAELISYGPIKGTMYFRPYGFSLWKRIVAFLDYEFEKLAIEEVCFPLLFPESFLKKEKEHIKGFAPEVFKVCEIGNKKLNEKLIVRPTSEVLFADYLQKTLVSYKELPIKLNQWVNILRWENNTKPFLRNSEFFWQEGHTIHQNFSEAKQFSYQIIKLYQNFIEKILLIPTVLGEKTASERFSGAKTTYTLETFLSDGQGIQLATSHFLANNFSKAFKIEIRDEKNQLFNPFQSSWGVSTRLLGSLILSHGDDLGLVLPSKIAPYQLVIVAIFNKQNKEKILNYCQEVKKILDKKFRVYLDLSEKGKGYKLQNWEIKGVPIIIEIGINELKEKKISLYKRYDRKRQEIELDKTSAAIIKKYILEQDKLLWNQADDSLNQKIKEVYNVEQIYQQIKSGYVCIARWELDSKLESEIKQSCGATIRLIKEDKISKKAINSDNKTHLIAYFARAY